VSHPAGFSSFNHSKLLYKFQLILLIYSYFYKCICLKILLIAKNWSISDTSSKKNKTDIRMFPAGEYECLTLKQRLWNLHAL